MTRPLAFLRTIDPRYSLRAQVALGLAMVGLLLTVLMAVLAERSYRAQLALSSGKVLRYGGQQLALNLKLGLAERLVEVERIAARLSEPEAMANLPTVRRSLEQLQAGRQELVWLGLVHPTGRVLAGTAGLLEGRDVSARPWFVAGLKGPWLGNVHEAVLLSPLLASPDKPTPLRLFDAVSPVLNAQGQTLAVVAAHIDWHWVTNLQAQLFEPMAQHSGIESMVFSHDGELLGNPDTALAKAASALMAQAEHSPGPTLLRWPDGQEYLTTWVDSRDASSPTDLPDLGWRILVRQPAHLAFAAGAALHSQILVGGLLLVMLLVALSWIMAGRLTQRLLRLADVTRRQQAGEAVLFTPTALGAHDEVADLAQALSQLDNSRRSEMAERQRITARYQALVEHSPDAIYINRRGHLTLVNQACIELFGAGSATELLGKSPFELIALDDHGLLKNRVHRLIDLGEPAPLVELHIVRLDGVQIEVESSAAPFDDDGQRSIMVVIRNITTRKRAERLLAQREESLHKLNTELEQRVQARTAELSAANAELDAFAYAVSHDLRAPLRAMNGFAVALEEDCGPLLNTTGREHLQQIRSASQRMAALIDGLLSLSRTVRGELRIDQVDISALAHELLAELAQTDQQAGTRYEVEPGLLVQGDARMLHSAMANLLGNAWKYSSKADQPNIQVYGQVRDGQPWICVQDNGVGFDMSHAQRLFKPFQRLHRQDEFAGLGIGLATVQRIVARHGGQLEAQATPGQGANFCFTLGQPQTASTAGPASPLQAPATP